MNPPYCDNQNVTNAEWYGAEQSAQDVWYQPASGEQVAMFAYQQPAPYYPPQVQYAYPPPIAESYVPASGTVDYLATDVSRKRQLTYDEPSTSSYYSPSAKRYATLEETSWFSPEFYATGTAAPLPNISIFGEVPSGGYNSALPNYIPYTNEISAPYSAPTEWTLPANDHNMGINSQNLLDLDLPTSNAIFTPYSAVDLPSPTEESTLPAIEPDMGVPLQNLYDLDLPIPESNEQASQMLSDLVGADVDARDLLSSTVSRELQPSTSQADPEPEEPLKKGVTFRAKDLPKCQHSAHIEAFIDKQIPYECCAKPVVRCVHCRDYFYQLPENLYQQFHAALEDRPTDEYKRHTIAIFLDYGEYDLLGSLIFSKQHDESAIVSNRRRVVFECHNVQATDMPEEHLMFAGEVLREALIGYFDLLSKCGYNSAHFKAGDDESRKWCQGLLDRAIEAGAILDCKTMDGNHQIYHFYEWLGKKSTRRNVSLMPMFEGDTLPTAIEDTINKQLANKRQLNANSMWLAVNNKLKKLDPFSFVADLSFNKDALEKKCPCQYCKSADDCRAFALSRRAQECSMFDSCQQFVKVIDEFSMRFDQLELAKVSTIECIQNVIC